MLIPPQKEVFHSLLERKFAQVTTSQPRSEVASAKGVATGAAVDRQESADIFGEKSRERASPPLGNGFIDMMGYPVGVHALIQGATCQAKHLFEAGGEVGPHLFCLRDDPPDVPVDVEVKRALEIKSLQTKGLDLNARIEDGREDEVVIEGDDEHHGAELRLE